MKPSKHFFIFWFGQSLSTLGDAFAMVAFPLLVLQASGSLSGMGAITACFGVGSFLMGLFSGVIVDRVDRRLLMIACDLLRALLFGAVPVVWWLSGPTLWLLYVIALFGGALGNLFMVSSITAVASLVPREELTQANGRLHATVAASFLLGPALAGLLSSKTGPEMALMVDAISFLVSAVALRLIRIERATPAKREASHWAELSSGFRFLWETNVLRWITILLCGMSFLIGATQDLFIYEMKEVLDFDDQEVGLTMSVASVGSLFGALLVPRARKRFGFASVWLAAFALQGVAMLCMTSPRSMALYMGIGLFIAASLTIRGVLSMSLRQEITPPERLGRVTAAFWLILYSPGPISAALLTRFAERTSITSVYTLIGVGILLLWVVGMLSPLRRYQEQRVG